MHEFQGKNWYAQKNTISNTPAAIDLISSGIADSMYSTYTGFTAVYSLVRYNTASVRVSKVSYYLDALELLCWLSYNHY